MQRNKAALLQALWRSSVSVANANTFGKVATASVLPSLASWTPAPHLTLFHEVFTHSAASQRSQIMPALTQTHRGFAAQAHARPQYRKQQSSQRRLDPSGTQGLYLVAFTVAMIGVTYASVPLYRMFCQATGYGGTVQQGATGTLHPDQAISLADEQALFNLKPTVCMQLRIS